MSDAPTLDAATSTDPAGAADAFAAGRLDEAAAICLAVLRHRPADPDASRLLGMVRLVQGDPAHALTLLAAVPDRADDVELHLALAEAKWATDSAAAAIPHLRRVLAVAPHRKLARARLGLALLLTDQAAEAATELASAHRELPHDALIATHLGMALLALDRPHEALPPLRLAVAGAPADPAAAFHLGLALRRACCLDEAIAAFRTAVARGPGQSHLLVGLGDALFARGDRPDAVRVLRDATRIDGASALAWTKLGDALQFADGPAAAASCYGRAAALDPGDLRLRALLGNALFASGATRGGEAELARSMGDAPWAGSAPIRRGERLRVGVVAAPGIANTPTDFLLDRAAHEVSPIFVLPGFDYPHDRIAAAFDVLFNAVSDPDAAPESLARTTALVPHLGLPVLNPPDAMPATTRDRMAARLSGIDGLLVPRTLRCRRAALLADPAPLDAFEGEILVRAVGSHGGQGLRRTADRDAARDAAASIPADDLYLTAFHDVRSTDGAYRKLRVVFVAGEPFPVHLAIGDDWLGHYFRTRMGEDATARAEEAAFLADPERYLGARVWAALHRVADRVGLDFFGLDGAVDRDGSLVLFECNATMLVRHAEWRRHFDYKRESAERVRDAMIALLRHRAH